MADEALANKTFEMVSNKQSDKKEKKPRKARAPMSAEARERAVQNLAKGRAKSLATRRAKAAAKEGTQTVEVPSAPVVAVEP